VSVIGLEELTRKAAFATGFTKAPFTFYMAAAVLYLIITSVTMLTLHYAERRAGRGMPGLRG
jgi:ABC-type arginine transport system permease subunit